MDVTSVTDRPDWLAFCDQAAQDLSLLAEWGPVLTDVLAPKAVALKRYRDIAEELVEAFGPLDGMSVLEIGGGYGGQAELLLAEHGVAGYQIVDLPAPRRLQNAYLASKGFALTGPYIADLAISNYAMSETRKHVQLEHAKSMRCCKRGYIRWNGWITCDFFEDWLTMDELLAELPTGTMTRPCRDDPRTTVFTWHY